MSLSMPRLFARNASRFSRLFVRLRVNKDAAHDYGEYVGQQMVVIQLPPGQTGNALEIQDSTGGAAPAQGAVLYSVDQYGNVSYGGSPNVSRRMLQVSLTAAQIIAMGTTAVNCIPAPAAGQAIVVDHIVVELNCGTVQFTAGGVVHFYYHGQTTEIMSAALAAATINGATGQYVFVLEPVATAGGSVVTPAVGVDITNATQAFATGNGTMTLTFFYSVITL